MQRDELVQMQEAMNHLVRVGKVVSTVTGKSTVRVQFDDADELVSFDMAIIYPRTFKDKHYNVPDIGDQVVCLFLPNGLETGFVLGSVYNAQDAPPVDSQDKDHVTYEDGTVIEYDRKAHVLKADVKGDAEIKTTKSIDAQAGTTITAKAADFIKLTAPTIFQNGNVVATAEDGSATADVEEKANRHIEGSLTVDGPVQINGNLRVNGNSDVSGNSNAGTRSGGDI